MSEWIAMALSGWFDLVTFVWQPPVTIGGSGVLTSSLTGLGVYRWQVHRARVLPALPSHAEALQGGHNEATRLFAALHELTMAVTEAWNATRAGRRGSVEAVIRRERLAGIVADVHAAAAGLRDYLAPYATADTRLRPVCAALDRLWTYTSQDNYRTEHYTTTETDSEGRTRTVQRTRQVYESTDHWFTLHRDQITTARSSLADWKELVRGTRWPRLNLSDRRVALDALDPAERSFLERLVQSTVRRDDAPVDDEQLELLLNQWLLGTRIGGDLAQIRKVSTDVDASTADYFQSIERSNERYHYRTGSRSHAGPEGYRAAQALSAYLGSALTGWRHTRELLDGAEEAADRLQRYAADDAVIESDMDYAREAVRVYQLAFPSSTIDVDRLPRHSHTALAAVGAGGLVAGLVYLAHPLA